MRVIAFVGLVSIEKIQLIIELATYYTWDTQLSVTVIDNVSRLTIDRAELNDEPLIRVNGDITQELTEQLADTESDIVLIAVSENAELDNLFIAFDMMREQLSQLDLTTVGLVDLRTCDCFPNLREKLESYTDVHFLAPFNVNNVLKAISE